MKDYSHLLRKPDARSESISPERFIYLSATTASNSEVRESAMLSRVVVVQPLLEAKKQPSTLFLNTSSDVRSIHRSRWPSHPTAKPDVKRNIVSRIQSKPELKRYKRPIRSRSQRLRATRIPRAQTTRQS